MIRRFNNLSLYKQLIIPMLVVGMIGMFATIYSAFVLEDSVSALGRIYIEGDKKLQIIEDVETSLQQYRMLSIRHVASEEAYTMLEIDVELEYIKDQIDNNISLISANQIKTQDHNAQKLLVIMNVYFESTSRIQQLSADFEKESAFEYLTKVETQTIPGIINRLQQLKRQEFEDFTSLRKSLMSSASVNLIVTITLGIVGGGLLLVIAFIVTQRITRRLYNLLNWSKKVALGDLSATLISDSEDEVGQLTISMKEMANSIRLAHQELANAKKKAEDAADELQIYANAFENSGEAILIADDKNRILNVNTAFTIQTGFSLDDVVGKDPKILSSGKTPLTTYQQLWKALEYDNFWQGELWDKNKDGKIYPKWIAISAIRDDDANVLFYIASFSDISERKENEARIEHLALHDILTGLHNRFNLENYLEQAIASSHRDQQKLAVLFIDLDRFKDINDSLGHHIGDQLLINVAARLRASIRDSDIASRIGGDEFVIVLTGMNDNSQAAIMAEKILDEIGKPFEISGHTLSTSPSIGISVYPEDGDSVDELLRTADVAMYHAKEHGRNTFHYFSESMFVAANERIKIERELRVALHSEQLSIHYQPQISSADLKIVSLEALIRWNHPEQGMISPEIFIPVAENAGIIHELGMWVINEVCRQIVAWESEGLTGYRIAINLSTKQLQSEALSEEIESIMLKHQIDGIQLEFEITETAAMSNPELAVQQLESLRKLGIRVSIDDFGTGYSSLAYLKRLPITALKLDKSFVRDIEIDSNDAVICTATIALAHNLNLTVVAEGVENEIQRDYLMENGCDYLQGYYFSKPLPADEILSFIHNYS